MKIAITAHGKGPEAIIDSRFNASIKGESSKNGTQSVRISVVTSPLQKNRVRNYKSNQKVFIFII